MKIQSRFFPLIMAWISLFVWQGCVSLGGATSRDYGVQDEYKGYVPGRIALVPCQLWPQVASFDGFIRSNMSDEDVQAACAALDQQVVAAFGNQPFMKGYSPKAITKFLQESKQESLFTQGMNLWRYKPDLCADCNSSLSFYEGNMKGQAEWINWLNGFSVATKHCDALLLPFVSYGWEQREKDRGFEAAKRALSFEVLLVDTATGDLLWAGRSRSVQRVPINLKQVKDSVAIPYPDWSVLVDRALSPSLWHEFPGRVSQ